MKVAITVTTCAQIGMETWRDIHVTKVFEETSTIADILNWAKTLDKGVTLSSLQISDVVE